MKTNGEFYAGVAIKLLARDAHHGQSANLILLRLHYHINMELKLLSPSTTKRTKNMRKDKFPKRSFQLELERAAFEFADTHLTTPIKILHFLIDAVFLTKTNSPQRDDFERLFKKDEALLKLIFIPTPFEPVSNDEDDPFRIMARTWLGRAWCATKYAVSRAASQFWEGLLDGLGLGPK